MLRVALLYVSSRAVADKVVREAWKGLSEARLLSPRTTDLLKHAVDSPAVQQAVIVLRDIEGWSAQEVCKLLGVMGGHQRVLLHRARMKARRAVEEHLDEA